MAAVLVVEDEMVVAMHLRQTLERMGHVVTAQVATSEHALRSAAERCPDIVLMDIRIEGDLDGIETAQILRMRFGVPVVYLTAHADDQTLARAMVTEPSGYVVKPFSDAGLRGAIETALHRHSMESRLRERERWASTALRSIGDALLSVDALGRVSFMNAAAEELTGIRDEHARGRLADEVLRLIDRDTREPLASPIAQALQGRASVGLPPSAVLARQDGTERAIDDSAAPMVDRSGEIVGAVVLLRDVTAQARLVEQAALADRLASLATLAAGLAHEINNPLTYLLLNAERVARALESPELREPAEAAGLPESVEAVRHAAERIAAVVADLASFSQPAGAAARAVDLRQCVEWALRGLADRARARARLTTRLSPVPAVSGDPGRLTQVITQLLTNAVEAIPEGAAASHELVVTTAADPARREVVLTVRDTGCGIPEHLRQRIFDPFFTTKPAGHGSGMGLAVAHGIVTALGGTLEVESTVGSGTTVRVRLPASEAATDPLPTPPLSTAPAPSRPPERPAAPAAPSASAAARRGRILVVDDEPAICRLLARMLADQHSVSEAHGGLEALRLLDKLGGFDLVLCDLLMPSITGMDVYERCLARDPAQARRIVFLTSGAYTVRASEFLASVPNARLTKPIPGEQLRAFVRAFLAEHGGLAAS